MAKKFSFRFDTMLKIRKQREDQQKRVVADSLRKISQVNEQIRSVERQIGDELEAVRSGQEPGMIDLQQAIRHRYWLGHLHRTALEAEAHLRFLEAKLSQERVVLTEAVKQRRILDKLKEKQWQRYQMKVDKRETDEADEMATVRYVFNRNEGFVAVGV